MAKRNRVLYAFTDRATYENLAKKDEYTVYFVYDIEKDDDGNEVPGEYGTIYKGRTRVGSALAEDIVFDKELVVHYPVNAEDDESVIHTISAGTSLLRFAKEAIAFAEGSTQGLRNEILGNLIKDESGNVTGDKPGEIRRYIAEAVSSDCKDEIYQWSEGNPENLATTIWVSKNFVTTNKLGKIEELANVLTDETIDKLIEAAQGIEKVLDNYYTKDQANARFDRVLVFDSSVTTADSSGFPEVGDASTLYIDDSENIMYRWALLGDDTTDRDYVEISGAGGSGSNATIETKLYFKNGKSTMTIAKNVPCTVEFLFSSAYTYLKYDKRTGTFKKEEQQTGTTGTAKYYLDGTLIGSGNVAQSNYNSEDDSKNVYNTFTIPAARFTGTVHELKIVCSDADGNSVGGNAEDNTTVHISIVSVSVVSSYTPTPSSLASDISIPVTVSSSNEINLYYKVDNDDAVLYKKVSGGASVYEPVLVPPTTADGTARTHGYHTIQIWATTYISETNTTISTEILSYNVIWYDVDDSTPIISTTLKAETDSDGNYNVTQYEYVTLNYQIYPKGTVNLIVADESGVETIVNTLDVNTTLKSWSYTFDSDGKYQMYIKVTSGDTEVISTKYPIIVAKSEYAMDPTPGAVLFFTAKNRSNDESADARSVWKSEIGDYTAKFNGFAWNTVSGWHKEDNSDTCSLRVGGGASVEIPFKPFDNDYRENGQTIEFEYMTSALSDSQTTVISCFSDTDKSGIIIKATGAEFYSKDFQGDSAISVPFKENEKIRISFVITPYAQDDKGRGKDDPSANITIYDSQSGKNSVHNSIDEGYWRFVKIYINGVLSSVNLYDNSFVQSTPATIKIGSDNATVDIYSIRIYNKVLYSKAIVDNMIGDTQDANEKIKLFKRNNILTIDGTDIDYTALMKQVPCLFVTCESTSNVDDYKNEEHILPRNKKDKRGFTVVYNADNLSGEAKKFYDFCTSFIAYNAQMTVQGTSSQYYPRKNWKLNFKSNKKYNSDWEAQVQTSKPTYLYTDDINAALGQKDNYQKDYILKDYDKPNPGTAYTSLERISSLPAKKFCLKADFAESSGTHNTGMARYVDFILKSLGKDYLTPPQYAQYIAAGGGTKGMSTVRTRTTVDGYPIAMFWRPTSNDDYSFYGKFNFNIDKGAENTFGFVDVDESLVNNATGKSFDLFNEDWYDTADIDKRFAYESPVECYEFLNNADDISKFKNVTDSAFTHKNPETGALTWLDAFELRHPDSDLQNEDFANGKDPINWRKFCKWVSSTDCRGYHDPETKLLPIAYEWTKSSNELITGTTDQKTYVAYNGTKDAFLEDAVKTDTAINKASLYVLYPEDSMYEDFGHIMEWSDEAGAWEDIGEYVEEQTADTSKIYYISDSEDINYGKLYKYNNITTGSSSVIGWSEMTNISISDYKLDAPIKYKNTTYEYDTAEYRLAKFTNELSLHMNISMTAAYYVLTEFFCMADQRAKNMMFASWGYEPGADKIKDAAAFADEESAAAKGYKPVYEYGDFANTVAAASFVNHQDSAVLGAAATNVCINEIYANSNLKDETGTTTDKSIELYNPTDSDINISGWVLTKRKGSETTDVSVEFSEGTSIPARGYFIVKCIKANNIGDRDKTNVLLAGISATAGATDGFILNLYNSSGELIDTVDNATTDTSVDFNYTTAKPYESYARITDGAEIWAPTTTCTLGAENIITEPEVVPVDTSTKLYSYQAIGTEIEGFSGLCWNADKSGFYAVSDKGKIYSLAFDGTAELKFDNYDAASGKAKGLVVDNTDTATDDYDFEAITIDTGGNLYVSTELYKKSDDSICPSKIIKIEKDFTKGTVIAEIESIGTDANQGLEGLTYYKDNMFFVGNQSNPISLFLYSFNKKTDGSDDVVGIVDNSSLPVVPNGITEIADLYFDASTDKLWLLDSNTGGFAALNVEVSDSGVTYTLDTLYSAPVKSGSVSDENPEALLIDSSNGFAYVGCDNTADKYLYKISLTNEYFSDNTDTTPDVNPDEVYRRVKYWVPSDCEYIYYPLFYDNDTILGLDNEGHIKFNPNVESTDIVGTGYAFNGTESVLWLNFKEAFASTIETVYSAMRKNGLTEQNCVKYFTTEHSDHWAEALYNVDAKFKYIDPETMGYLDYQYTDPSTGKLGVNRRDSTYLYEAQGSRAEHRNWWINNRFVYMDSRYNTGSYFDNYVTMRVYTPTVYNPTVPPESAFKLIPYSDMYLRIKFGSTYGTVRAEKNKEYTISSPMSTTYNDTETIIYGPDNILSFGDMSNKYARTAQFNNATKATEIKFGAASPYYNKNLTEIALGANNSVLKTIDVRGSNNLNSITSLNEITSLETFRATDTAMSTVNFSTKGAKLKLIEYPAVLTQIKLVNMPDITNDGVKVVNYANVQELWIESCPNINTWMMFSSLIGAKNSRLNAVRLTDINWTINSSVVYEYWKRLLAMRGISDTGLQNLNIPYLTGVVTIGENVAVSTGYKENVERLFKNVGCELTINTKTAVDVRSITIVGETDIAVGEEYTYTVSYNPDDYIKTAQRGVIWEIPNDFTIISETDETVTVKYTKSTSGNLQYDLKATSKYNTELTAAFNVKPVATLSAITLTDSEGNILNENSIITVDEESPFTITVGFIPAKTKDTSVGFRLTGAYDNAFEKRESGNLYEYDETTRQLTFYAKAVSTDITAGFQVYSTAVDTVRSIAPTVKVKNVIARVVSLVDANGNTLQGTLNVTYKDAFTGETKTDSVQNNASGDFIFKTNTKYGFGELTVYNIKPTAAFTRYYNNIGTYVFNEVNPDTAVNDIKQTFVFYEPVEYTVNIWHDTTAITDASLNIYSLQNDNEYGLTNSVYNNVISKTITDGGVEYCQMKIKLLANTTHNITVSEVTSGGTPITKGNTYEILNTTITTGTVNSTVNLYLSRDYLGDIESYSGTELRMTVKTGIDYTSLRLFVNTSAEITINWGDGSSTKIDGVSAASGTEDHSFETELQITHAYASSNTEYDITVKNTAPITWFHVIKSTAANMTPCFFKGSDINTLPTAWAKNIGGLVAYQSVGAAKFSKAPTFKVAKETDKQYIEFACVGYLYNNIESMEAADELFMNTKLEQIPAKSIFAKNTGITSFNRTFKNSNITSIPTDSFRTNTKAVSFEETFSGCKNLVTLNSSEDSALIYLDDALEIQSLYRMFYNCSKLTDKVPALWKTFYGCSKARNSKSYEGCGSAGNYNDIPRDWGGIGDIYYESQPKILDYLQFIGGEGYFQFDDIILTNNMRYELDMTKERIYWYEGMPIIGGGYATDVNNPENTLQYAIDFLEGGDAKGCRSNAFYSALRCRIGAEQSSDFLPTTTKQNDLSAAYTGIFPKVSNDEQRHKITLDICKTYSGTVIMTDATNNQLSSPKTYIYGWTNDICGVGDGESYNLPMRLFGSYDSYHNTPGEDPNVKNESTGYDPDYSETGYHIPMMAKRNFSREIFHELKIYSPRTAGGIGSAYDNPEQDLIHDIVPAFGMIEDTLTPFMYDKITKNTYAYSSQHGDITVLTNDDRGVTNFDSAKCAIFYPKK